MESSETLDFDRLESLARQVQAGDDAVYERLLEELYAYVRCILVARLGWIAELDDLTQTCLLAMHRSLPTYHPSRTFRPWLHAIIRYKVADHFRALARRKEVPQTEEILDLANQSAVDRPDSCPQMDPVNIRELLTRLPENWADAIRLTKFEGLSCTEAADRQGISAAALRKRLSRAYRKLADLIETERES